jgi:XTP/dITP diphosphohydrolase
MKIVLATRNLGKQREIRELLQQDGIEVLSLKDFPDCPDSDEPFSTYLENARDKARLVAEHCACWALADDSGLEVDALQGRPGVLSARYAGDNVSYEDNYLKILRELNGIGEEKRGARFRCCMVLRHPDGREFSAEGVLEGRITTAPKGAGGFGYDPIFFLPEKIKTLAELSLVEKNKISHRHLALVKMIPILQSLYRVPSFSSEG